MRSRSGSRLASMKASISGWSQARVAIMAPRRAPALITVRHMESQTSMNDSGPEASAPTPWTRAPLWRMVEKSKPMPPPCCRVSAASRTWAKMPPMSSGIVPITKQLKSVTERPVPAPARMRPAGRNWKPVSRFWKRPAHKPGADSGSARARATRLQVSSMVLSTGSPSAVRKRYLRSHICCEIADSEDMTLSSRRTFLATRPDRPLKTNNFLFSACGLAVVPKVEDWKIYLPALLSPAAAAMSGNWKRSWKTGESRRLSTNLSTDLPPNSSSRILLKKSLTPIYWESVSAASWDGPAGRRVAGPPAATTSRSVAASSRVSSSIIASKR